MDVREVVDRINEDIVEIISNYVDLKTIGNKYKACCPFHNEKTPSFTVTPAKGIFKCYGCGKGGDAITFLREHESVGFREAVELGAKKLNLDFNWMEDRSNFSQEEYNHKEALRIVCQRAAEFFQDQLKNNPEALKFVRARGYDPFAEKWTEPVKELVKEDNPKLTMLRDAAEMFILSGKVGSSILQRKMKITVKRSNELIDELESLGLVTEEDGKRKMVITEITELETFFAEAQEEAEENSPNTEQPKPQDNRVIPFMLGFAPEGNELIKWAKKETISLNLLIEADLIKSKDGREYDTFRNRIMFPIANKTGKIIGFTGRTLSNDKAIPKYLNTGDTSIFQKGNELFALNIARGPIKKDDRAYLVEGNFDVTRLHQIGITNAIAPCGTALTPDQAKLLKAYTNKVTLIYDGDSAGQKAMEKNSEILIKEQFYVSVITLPADQDPDTAFRTFDDFDRANSEQTDYILQKTAKLSEKAKNPAYKAEAIKDISFLITRYDNASMHEVLLEEVSKIIPTKKLWQDHIKNWMADKAPVETKKGRVIPSNVSLEEYNERGFYVHNNCMYFADKKGQPERRSNFIMTPLFHIPSTINAKRIYEVKNNHGSSFILEIPQKDLVSISAFKVRIESLGNFLWEGSETDLNRLKAWLYEKTQSAKEITQMGLQRNELWVWGNGIFNGKFTDCDAYGIATHNNENFYIPSASRIYSGEDNLFEFERKFINMEGNVTLREYIRDFTKVFGDNGKIALCYYFSSLFRDIVVKKFGKYPLLNMFGPKGAGKNACAESLLHFFGLKPKIPNLHNTSKAALAEHVATSANALCVLDEYRNDLEMEKREFLKGLWDGTGRTRMNMDKDKKKETTSVDQGVIICGQQMATADIALFSRFIVLSFTQTEFSKEEKDRFERLEETNKRGLTHITHQILKHRASFKERYSQVTDRISAEMEELLDGKVCETRVFNNWLMVLSAYATLDELIELPWDSKEMLKLAVKLMLQQNGEMKKNDDLGHFWKVVEYLCGSNMLYDGGDFKIVYTDRVKRRYMECGDWKEDTVVYQESKQLFYLTTSRVFSMYKSQCLREGDKPMPEATIEYYLKNSKAFLFETKKESFKKIDPKTGLQEVTRCMVNGVEQITGKKRTSTTAFVFDYSLLNISIETGNEGDDPEPDRPKFSNEASQQEMSFPKQDDYAQPEEDDLPF